MLFAAYAVVFLYAENLDLVRLDEIVPSLILAVAGAALVLDLTEMRGTDPGPYLVPVHGILRVTLEDHTLIVARLDYDRFMGMRTQKGSGLPASAVDDRRNAVITVPTRELRRWLGAAPADAFGEPSTKQAVGLLNEWQHDYPLLLIAREDEEALIKFAEAAEPGMTHAQLETCRHW